MNGYSILLPGRELAFDHAKGRPYFVTTKRAAVKALAGMPAWLGDGARVVEVKIEGDVYEVQPC